MMQVFGIAFAMAIVGIFVAVIATVVRANQKRMQMLDALFTQLGDTFWPEPTDDQRQQAFAAIGAPQTLRHGAKRVRWAAQTLSQGAGAWMLEHAYTVSTGNSSQTIYHVVASCPVPSSWQQRGNLRVSRAHLGTMLGRLFGAQDITLGDPEFDAAFRVEADDQEFAMRLLTPQVRRWLLDAPPKWSLEVGGGAIRVLHKGQAGADILARLIAAPRTVLGLCMSGLPEKHAHRSAQFAERV